MASAVAPGRRSGAIRLIFVRYRLLFVGLGLAIPVGLSLTWLLAQKPWIVPIPGTTKLAHLGENLATADLRFTPDELRSLDSAISTIKIYGDRYTGVE